MRSDVPAGRVRIALILMRGDMASNAHLVRQVKRLRGCRDVWEHEEAVQRDRQGDNAIYDESGQVHEHEAQGQRLRCCTHNQRHPLRPEAPFKFLYIGRCQLDLSS